MNIAVGEVHAERLRDEQCVSKYKSNGVSGVSSLSLALAAVAPRDPTSLRTVAQSAFQSAKAKTVRFGLRGLWCWGVPSLAPALAAVAPRDTALLSDVAQ